MINRPVNHFVNFCTLKLFFLRTFLGAVFVLSYHFCFADTYYFSSVSGDDRRSAVEAQNPNTPWKSIEKLNVFFPSLKAGDAVMFKRGETFYGSIIVNGHGSAGNPIIFSAFGVGNNPIITAFVTLTEWQPVGNGVYESQNNLLGSNVNVLVLNNQAQEMGRYPNASATNKGWLTIKSHNNNSITDPNNTSGINWKGAEIVIRKNHWIIDRHIISNQSGNTITYIQTNDTHYYPTDGYGYFIQNDLRTLDAMGEWYYNPATKKMYIYFGTNLPSSFVVQASTIDNIVYANKANGQNAYLTFENLTFNGANAHAFSLSYGSNIVIRNCNLESSGNSAISAYQSTYTTVEKCIIKGAQNNGVYLNEKCHNSKVSNNTISNTMNFPGLGQNGDHKGLGVYVGGDNMLVEYNNVLNTGYTGIYFAGESITVKNNLVDNFCLLKDDGSGIYTFTGSANTKYSNRKVIGNIILNGIGAREGSDVAIDSKSAPAKGFYADDNATGILLESNTISKISDHGIFIHNGRDINLRANTVFNNTVQLALAHDELGEAITNVSSTENIFFSKTSDQLIGKFSNKDADIAGMGKFDNNFYVRPFDQGNIIQTEQFAQSSSYTSKLYDLESWKYSFKQDGATSPSPVILPQFKLNNYVGGNKLENGNFDTNANGVMFYASSGSPTSGWDNTNKLGSGGSLKLTSPSPSFLLINFGAVDVSKKYILRFKVVGNKEVNISAFIRQFNSPHAEISSVSTVKVLTTSKTYECLFSFPKTEANACITFSSQNNDFTYWLDNIEFYEASVTNHNPDDYILFEYNATPTTKSVNLSGSYIDHKNRVYSGSVSIPSYSSIVLIKTSPTSTPSPPVVTGDNDRKTLISTHGQFQSEIVYSENGGGFKAYTDTIKVGEVARAAGYWKFKIKAAKERNESDEVGSPAFTITTIVTPTTPILNADDIANTLTATHDQYSSEIVFSENDGSYQSYTGTISVGNVSRAAGYWKFKVKSGANRAESAVVSSPAFTAVITPSVPVLSADDVANTLSASHDTYAGDIVVSENGGSYQLYSGTIQVGNVARPEGYWKFKLRTGTNHGESAVVPSPTFSVTGTPTSPKITADDIANTLTATHDQYSSEIVFSENDGSYQSYTGTISVGNVSRAAGYWKFKVKSGANRAESAVVSSPAFTAVITPSVPVLSADDVANTLSASHDTYAGDIVVSENGGSYQLYSGTIQVGNVARPEGYWKFKLRTGTNHGESAVVPSPTFSVTGTPTSPKITADDIANTLTATHDQYSSEIVFSENDGSYQSYTGTISVGNVSRAAGYWKFKVKSGANRAESAVVSSPAFTAVITPSVPVLSADDVANTLSASHDTYAGDIVVSENGGSYQLYSGTIQVGNVARPEGYWKFKIRAGDYRIESSVVKSPNFYPTELVTSPDLFADDVANTLIASHATYPTKIVVSENNGSYQPYTGTINVGNIYRAQGYWKFKISASATNVESPIVSSPVFTIPDKPSVPKLLANDILNTLVATHDLYNNDILVSENGGNYKSYTGVINVGDINRAEGYWKFKIEASINRLESDIVSSPAFTLTKETLPPVIVTDNIANTLTATHDLFPENIVYSENYGDFIPYTSPISVGKLQRPSGYWRFKIVAGVNRKESTIVNSPQFNGISLNLSKDLVLYPNPVQSMLHVKHPEVTTVGVIIIISVSGQKLKSIIVNKGILETEIDVINLPPGTFILLFNEGTIKLAKTFIKIE
ncbi:right-handed parallel beta-helix repeat-containing protein [Pedobacter agri]|uniref:Right-handed parallel beta-helix repeat-containing protein n=1 Tax=Pedobacter agri TaxID=454586 RepID=A0A9X3DDD9_9SPHI|nr:right-handed parallel beta-helix repeat-containing protein [Pedobacter agri]MCX3264021.1 right-handed parallel beta-helix repeat-containing protein [Pedobacter agri]